MQIFRGIGDINENSIIDWGNVRIESVRTVSFKAASPICHSVSIHSVSFISSVYKQRFFQPVDLSEKNKQRTSWNQNGKQHIEII